MAGTNSLGSVFRLGATEAKRRARQRKVFVAVAGVALAAAGAATVIVASASSGVRPLQAALEPSLFSGPDQPGVGKGKPARFGITVSLTNGSSEPLILEHVRAVLTARSSQRQIAAQFVLYKRPVCPEMTRPGLCIPDFGLGVPQNGAKRPSPLHVAPGREALVQLTFRFATCTSRALLESVSIQKFTVVYRLPNGTRVYQHPRVPLFQPSGTAFGPLTTSAMPSIPGQPASRRLHTVGWVTTNPCQR